MDDWLIPTLATSILYVVVGLGLNQTTSAENHSVILGISPNKEKAGPKYAPPSKILVEMW